MREICLYIAMSLDGFIAKKDGDVSWLEEHHIEGQDYGYSEFLRSVDAIVMGSKTFEQLPSFGPWPYGDVKTYVLTERKLLVPEGAQVTFYSGSLEDLIPRLREESRKGIWLAGGGAVVQSFMRLGGIDRIIITIIPTLLGEGIALFGDRGREAQLNLLESRTYENGITQLHYRVKWDK